MRIYDKIRDYSPSEPSNSDTKDSARRFVLKAIRRTIVFKSHCAHGGIGFAFTGFDSLGFLFCHSRYTTRRHSKSSPDRPGLKYYIIYVGSKPFFPLSVHLVRRTLENRKCVFELLNYHTAHANRTKVSRCPLRPMLAKARTKKC